MNVREIRGMVTDDIRRKVDETYEELFNLRFRLATKQLTNHREVRRAKRKIARIKTVLRERELAGAQS